MFIHCQ